MAPKGIELEEAVIGSILIDDTYFPEIKELVSSDDFEDTKNKYVFACMERLHDEGKEIDLITLTATLSDLGLLETVGGSVNLSMTTQNVSIPSRVVTYARELSERSAKRRISNVANEMSAMASSGKTLDEALDFVQKKVHEVNNIGGKRNKFQVTSMLDHVSEARSRFENRDKVQGLKTGFPSIDKLTMGLGPGELIIVAGPTSKGKQQRVSEIIPTPSGDKRFGDLTIGDYVFGSNGKPTKVTGTFPQGIQDIYRVNFSDGSYLDTGRDHLWTLQRNGRPDMTVTSKELMDKLPSPKYHIPVVDPIEYSDDHEPIPAYELGMYIADGSVNSSQIYITKHKGRISDYLQDIDSELIRYDHPATCGRLRGRAGSKLMRYVKSCGLSKAQSRDKFIPNEWFNKSASVRIKLLQGLMDGDGSVEGNSIYTTTSAKLADDVVRLATSLGCLARKSIIKHKRGNYWSVRITRNNFDLFLHKKVKSTSQASNRRKHRTVKSVEIVGKEEAMCISVEAKDQLYVGDTRFHIVTHNTLLSMSMASRISKNGGKVLFVTLEMTKVEMTSRYMYINGGHESNDFKTVAANTIFQENDELDWKDIDGLIQNAKQELDVDLVIIDHLHYFARDIKNASEELGKITMTFKKNALRHKIPIILISHIKKLGKDEELSSDSLRGSSLIAQDSDIVLLVNRDPETNQMGVLVDKNRNRGKLSDRTKEWAGRSQREIDTIYLDFNNTKLHDPLSVAETVLNTFPGAEPVRLEGV